MVYRPYLRKKSVGPSRVRLARQRAVSSTGYVNVPCPIHRQTYSHIVTTGSELLRQDLLSRKVIYTKESVGASAAALARQRASSYAPHIDTSLPVHRHTHHGIRFIGAELAGPEHLSRRVVLTKKGVDGSCARLARQGAGSLAQYVDVSHTIRRHIGYSLIVIGAELAGPERLS